MKKRFVLIMSVLFGVSVFSSAQDVTWMMMARGGTAYNFRTPLVIKQEDFPILNFSAKYATRPLAGPPYYEFHFVRWSKQKGWGLKITHHKLYLQNNPPEVQRFTITDGYNLLTVTRQWKMGGLIYHIGGGAVLTHPESMIRERRFSETKGFLHSGYHLSGPVGEVAVEKRVHLSRRLMLSFEGRGTVSYVKVPVAGGYARTSNVALHGLAGLGYKLYGKKLLRQ